MTLLILGGSSTGKTVYGTQLLGRLRQGVGRLSMRGAPRSVAQFEQALDRLAQGLAPEHTGALTYHEMVIPILGTDSTPVDLVWPDYGGEQIRDIIETRRVPLGWQQQVVSGDGWILFIRLDRSRIYDDPITRPTSMMEVSGETPAETRWSESAALIELLQILLFLRRTGVLRRVKLPPLLVMLSCWDELRNVEAGTLPSEELKNRLPLFSDFINAIWARESLAVLSLSSQGRILQNDIADKEYIDKGPQKFGYVVLPDGSHSDDLTLPVAEILARI